MKRIATRLMALLMLTSTLTPTMAAVVIEPTSVSVPTASEPDPEKVKAALNEFKELSRKEKRHRLKDARKLFKDYKAAKKEGRDAETDQVLLAILAILLPPLAVYLKEDDFNGRFWLSVLLTLIFWIPGVVFALLVVFDVV